MKYSPILFLCFMALHFVAMSACTENDPSQASNPLGELDAGDPDMDDAVPDESDGEPTLKAVYRDYFPIGVAVETDHLEGDIGEILKREFNRITAENVMKFGPIHPYENNYKFEAADQIARFAVDNNMTMTGHTLVNWRQNPNWLWVGGLTPGTEETVEILKARLKAHIETLVEQYYDVVDNWDVVNEAISDISGAGYRTESRWYTYFGSEEYIYWAFQYTKDALEAVEPGGSDGKLYYNDYNVNQKKDSILDMLAWLENEKGIRIDGVGMQAHWRVDWPSIFELKGTLKAFIDAGYDVKISELDISIYNDYSGGFHPEEEKEFTEDLELAQAERYRDIFELFRENAPHVTSVTLWGVSDDDSWLDQYPVSGRNNYPLLFDDNHQPKEAYYAILDF